MKINMSFPATGCQKLLEITDELKVIYVFVIVKSVRVMCDELAA